MDIVTAIRIKDHFHYWNPRSDSLLFPHAAIKVSFSYQMILFVCIFSNLFQEHWSECTSPINHFRYHIMSFFFRLFLTSNHITANSNCGDIYICISSHCSTVLQPGNVRMVQERRQWLMRRRSWKGKMPMRNSSSISTASSLCPTPLKAKVAS